MPASGSKYILGERFWLLKSDINKAEATKIAVKERDKGFHVRLEKVVRGNYKVWTSRKWANL